MGRARVLRHNPDMRAARLVSALLLTLLFGAMTGCQTMPATPLPTVDRIELERYMGPWYVIAHIPSWPERNAFNAVETYALAPDGSIATTFTFNAGRFDGPVQTMRPRGFVRDRTTNATWGMQFVWPIKAEYLITYIDPDYTQTIVSRSRRDYVWIMARTPTIPEADYTALVARVAAQGYDVTRLRRVPQQSR